MSYNIILLHSRLSIIDIDDRSNQPFTIGDATIIFNGEIYNYIELRNRLLRKGIDLVTQSDTEVLLYYYLQYGESCVNYFEGMWSFAIWDNTRKALFMSRDRFGEKPLYYMDTSEGFYFASEIKYLKELYPGQLRVNQKQIMRGLVNGYKSLYKSGELFYENVKKLGFAQNLILTPGKEVSIKRYWNLSYRIDNSLSMQDAVLGTRHRLIDNVTEA